MVSASSCKRLTGSKDDGKKVLLLYTNDEHGHIWEKKGGYKGVLLYEMWSDEEKRCENCEVIKLSGGDNYTGSAISSLFEGESTARVMKELGYWASAVGNHEFDYGFNGLIKNSRLSEMKYISSNVLGSSHKPVFAESLERGGLGFVGVTTEELRNVTLPSKLKNIWTVDTRNPVRREMKKLSGKVDGVVVISHESFDESRKWFDPLEKKPLVVFNAHTHNKFVKKIGETTFVQAGKYFGTYARVELEKVKGEYRVVDAKVVPLKEKMEFKDKKSERIKEIIDGYLVKMEKIAGEEIGFARNDFSKKDFMKLYTCSLFLSHDDLDAVFTNPGAFRDVIGKGVVKKSDIISVLPFENRLVRSTISGTDLIHNLNLSEDAYCGVEKKNGRWLISGKTVDPESRYKVLINEFMYGGGDKYRFVGGDNENIMTPVNWRKPLVNTLKKYEKSKKSLEEILEILKTELKKRIPVKKDEKACDTSGTSCKIDLFGM